VSSTTRSRPACAVRYAGGGRRSDAIGENRRWEGSVDAGAVLDTREVVGDLILRGEVRYHLPGERLDWGFDVSLDGLFDIDDPGFDADVEIGPRLGFPLPGGRRADLFLHYLRSRHPLGLDLDAVLAGFEFSETGPGGRSGGTPPDIFGSIAAGGGEGRLAGRFRLAFLSPPFLHDTHAVIEIDANILTAEDTGELYYFYHVGLERSLRRHQAGAYFYHRSNHALAEPNDTITSFNVLEAGVETPSWDRPPSGGKVAGWDRLDWRIRGGLLLDSTFGEDRRWHVRAGCRYLTPVAVGRAHLFLQAEMEEGDISRRSYATGILDPTGLGARLEYRDDDQYYGADQTALLVLASYWF